jgi:hypothetical protein
VNLRGEQKKNLKRNEDPLIFPLLPEKNEKVTLITMILEERKNRINKSKRFLNYNDFFIKMVQLFGVACSFPSLSVVDTFRCFGLNSKE